MLVGLLIIVGVLAVYVALCFVHDIWGLNFLKHPRESAVRETRAEGDSTRIP